MSSSDRRPVVVRRVRPVVAMDADDARGRGRERMTPMTTTSVVRPSSVVEDE